MPASPAVVADVPAAAAPPLAPPPPLATASPPEVAVPALEVGLPPLAWPAAPGAAVLNPQPTHRPTTKAKDAKPELSSKAIRFSSSMGTSLKTLLRLVH